jgi:hypothetical protein
MSSVTSAPDISLFEQIKSDLKLYSSILCVLDKTENDAYLPLLSSALQFIFQKEMGYAIAGLVIRVGQDEGEAPCDRLKFPSIHQHPNLQREP